VRIHYFSDIHLEFGELKLPLVEADMIVAAGDIGVGLQGLKWLQEQPLPVIYVAGNHEFYGHDHGRMLLELELASEGGHVHFLENRSVVLGDIRFLGCTLWTNLGDGEADTEELLDSVNDFHKIRYQGGVYRIDQYRWLNWQSRQWLEQMLAKPFSGKTVVVTHHAPTFWSWGRSPSALNRYAYCNDLRELMYQYDIAAWFHGHTHSVWEYRCADTHVLCNPRGYHGRKPVEAFKADKVFEI